MEPLLVYYSSSSGNTQRFIENAGIPAIRIPISPKQEMEPVTRPYVLICPTYADDDGSKAIPKQVIRFLNDIHNRSLIVGVVGTGNRNFGALYGYAGNIIARKCEVPLLCKFELSGTIDDIQKLKSQMGKLWTTLQMNKKQTASAI